MITIKIAEAKKLKEKYSAFVSFDYDMQIVNVLRGLAFRFYDTNTKTWEIHCADVKKIIFQLQDFDITLDGQLSELEEKETITDLPKEFKFKTKPFSHQLKGIEYGLKYDKWFLGDEPGLGKSKQSIDIAVARKLIYGYKHCLIVCGVNTLKWNWVNEVHTHSNENAWILGQQTTKQGKVKIGSTSNKVKDLDNIDELPYFIITNIESFRDKTFADKINILCKKDKINMCIADELHKCKNPASQQTKGFLKCLPQCRIGMTGTPLMNSPLDLYVILKWLGYENHAFYSFKQHYCVMGGYGGYEVIGYKNLDQLTSQMQEIMLRRLKSDVLDLPEKVFIDEYVEMGGKQSIIYKEVEMDIKANIDMVQFENNPLATLIRLRQATGYTGILSSEIKESAKLDRMCDIVEECVLNNEKVLIFSNWKQMTDAIMDKLTTINLSRYATMITGDTKDNERQDRVQEFQTNNNVKIMIGTVGAMGTGLTLTAATTVIFVDEPWNKALYDQALDRAHRIGQKNNITVWNLLTKDTIDEKIHNLIYKKGVMSDAIIDGRIVGNKTEIFNYLLN